MMNAMMKFVICESDVDAGASELLQPQLQCCLLGACLVSTYNALWCLV
jgi:hypothetical protein